MQVLLFICGIVALVTIIWVIDVYRHRHPLDVQEVIALSRKRQRNLALNKFDFSTRPQLARAAEKKAMKGEGEFVRCDLRCSDAPARIAGLLKYKKHEWIVVAFINSFRVRQLWWNKGPDGTRVWSFLGDYSLKTAIESLKPDAIAVFHNHPNPNPSLYRTNIPSEADLLSAGLYDTQFSRHGVSLLEFICERGTPHLYYASFSDTLVPLQPIIDDIRMVNGAGIFENYRLRKELKAKTGAEHVRGGQNKQAVPQEAQ